MTIFDGQKGTTKLDPDDIEGLIPDHVNTISQLNEYEHNNILLGEMWYSQKSFDYNDILDIGFINQVHFKMFNKTWKWAGKFRQTEKNIGVDPQQIAIRLKQLLDDVIYQIEHNSYEPEEISARFHHRLVYIHPYPNGNGRHARTTTDLLLTSLGCKKFLWGENLKNEFKDSDIRSKYLQALKAADKGDYKPLFTFLRR